LLNQINTLLVSNKYIFIFNKYLVGSIQLNIYKNGLYFFFQCKCGNKEGKILELGNWWIFCIIGNWRSRDRALIVLLRPSVKEKPRNCEIRELEQVSFWEKSIGIEHASWRKRKLDVTHCPYLNVYLLLILFKEINIYSINHLT